MPSKYYYYELSLRSQSCYYALAMTLGREPLPSCLITQVNMKAVPLTIYTEVLNPPHNPPHKVPYYKQCISLLCPATQVKSIDTKLQSLTKTLQRCFAKRKPLNYFYTYHLPSARKFFPMHSSISILVLETQAMNV